MTIALLLVCALSSAFVLIYGLTRPWWKSWEGRALIASSTGWTLVSGGFLFDAYAHDVPDWAWLLVTYVALVAAALKLWILVRSRRRDSQP